MAAPQPHIVRPVVWLADAAATALVGVAGVGGLVRMTVRDADPHWAAIYYSLPLIVIAALLTGAGTVWLLARRRQAFQCFAVALLLAGIWVTRNTYSNECRPRPDDVRVLLLNTARGHAGWYRVASVLPPFDVDIIGLVEAGSSTPARQKFWEENFPTFNVVLPGGGLAIITRGDIRRLSIKSLAGISRYADAEIDLNGRLVRVLLVDLDASPFFDKRRLLGTIFRAAESLQDVPTIIMGDFNTPIDSRWFDRERSHVRHVFEEGGAGLLVTWPTPLPLVAIDHIWVSRGTVVTCATLESHAMSDHRLVTAHLALPEDETARPPEPPASERRERSKSSRRD